MICVNLAPRKHPTLLCALCGKLVRDDGSHVHHDWGPKPSSIFFSGNFVWRLPEPPKEKP
jgi:hypothetical protein